MTEVNCEGISAKTCADLKQIQADNAARRAREDAIAALTKATGASTEVATAAFNLDKNPANDLMQTKALNSALNAYTAAKDSWQVWGSHIIGGPSDKVVGAADAAKAAKAAGAGPNDVPNIVKAAEKLYAATAR